MSNLTTLNKYFYNELINRFFHPKSYFLFCISKYLNGHNSSNNQKVLFLINNLINKLTQTETPVAELEKISSLKGFHNFNSNLEKQISQLDITNTNRDKMKELIESVSHFVFNKLTTILQNDDAQQSLAIYLKLDNDILQTNDQDSNNLATILPDKDEASHFSTKKLFENNGLLEKFFTEEVTQALKLINKYTNLTIVEIDDNDFFNDWEKCFQQIKSLAMMHGYDKIEAIADRILRVISICRSLKIKLDNQIKKILSNGMAAIQDSAINRYEPENICNILNDFDLYFQSIEKKSQRINNEEIEEQQLIAPELTSDLKELSQLKEDNADKSKKKDEFKIPGENDPELLSLIDEIVSSKKTRVDKLYTITANNENKKVIEDGRIDKEIKKQVVSTKEDEYDKIVVVKLFNKETILYFKLLNTALKKLTQNNSDATALEDLELASSSLKSHAMKFGFEKLSQIPRTIEKIAKRTLNENLAIPPKILHTIAEGVILLQTFVDNDPCRDKFRTTLNDLDKYLNRLRKIKKDQQLIHV